MNKCRKYSYRKCINSRKSRRSNFSLKQSNKQSISLSGNTLVTTNNKQKELQPTVVYCEATSIVTVYKSGDLSVPAA